MEDVERLKADGYCVLPALFDDPAIECMRNDILANTFRMGRTRRQRESFHLAGFHRYPVFSKLHADIVSHRAINDALERFFATANYYTIGLSDITINRSQHWHTDLLRGSYSRFLGNVEPWGCPTDTCIKALVYLQPGRSLRIVPGSHLRQTPLDDESITSLPDLENSMQLTLRSGDVVLMDIRAVHRGATDTEMNSAELALNPKILVSTVFGKVNSDFAGAIQMGNLARNIAWDRQWLETV